MKRLVVVIAAAGCAQGGGASLDAQTGTDAPRVDAPVTDGPMIDGPVIDGPMIDAPMIDAPMIDAPMIDAPMIDAPMVDAPCVPVNTQLLVNASFDASPVGTGWTQQLIEAGYPLVTAPETGAAPTQAGPYYAWLGGFEATSGPAADALYQNVTIPANTTQLRLAGYYFVGSDEDPDDSNVWDTSVLTLAQVNNTPIVTVLSLSNRSETTAWTSFSHTFVQNLSGQTLRVRMTSNNDVTNASAFWFDTLSLTATHCP